MERGLERRIEVGVATEGWLWVGEGWVEGLGSGWGGGRRVGCGLEKGGLRVCGFGKWVRRGSEGCRRVGGRGLVMGGGGSGCIGEGSGGCGGGGW